jgi:hypothetical protein
MPLNDSQLIGLLQLLLAQQKDVLQLKATVLALQQFAVELGGDDVKQRLFQLQQEAVDSNIFHGTRAAIGAFEQLLAQSLPTTGAKN